MNKDNKSYPPFWADRLLEWFCKHRIIEDIQGDLHELYYERLKSEGYTKARWHFILDVVRSFRRFAFKKPQIIISNIMTKHYLTIAWRAFRKHPHYSVLNLLGLSIGLAGSILIFSYLKHE